MKLITLDFETYYSTEYSLSKVTTEEYIRGKEFEVIGVATKVDDGPIVWVTGNKVKKHLASLPWEDHLLLAQNTAFDGAILNWRYGITPVGYLDTMSMANALHGVSESSSLANLAKKYEEADKGDAVIMAKGKHLVDFTTEELEVYGEYCIHDTELCYNIFHKMLPVFPKGELKVVDMTIRMFAEPTIEVDRPLLEDDLINIRAERRSALLMLMNLIGVKSEESLKKLLMSNDKFAELLRTRGIDPPTKTSPKTGKQAWAFAKTDEALTSLGDSEDPIVATLVATRLDSRSTITETRTDAFIGISERGAYPFSLLYSGAKVTHRWSGFDTNPQNLPRGSTLRKALMATEGHTLVVADLSNIELRVGMWLAGQDDAVKQLKDGIDLYRMFAAEAFNISYDKIAKDSEERFIAKVCCLSLIYGTGAPKLQDTIRIQSKGRIIVTLEEAERLKDLYRTTNINVVGAWQVGSDILDWILADKEHTAYKLLPVRGAKGIEKPNGLILSYPELARKDGDKGYGYDWTYKVKRGSKNTEDRVYGAKVYQRIVQSLSRDIMAANAVDIDAKYLIAGLVHDEIICPVLDESVEDAKKFIKKVMRKPPKWAAGLPLDCEVGAGKRYGDAK